MAKLTWEVIAYDLEDALEELQRLTAGISSSDAPDEVEFRIAMQHIYHHLNFAWNARHVSIQDYTDDMKERYDQWGKFPEDLEFPWLKDTSSKPPSNNE